MRELIFEGTITACHDCSDGGICVALAEMAIAGNLGGRIGLPDQLPAHVFLFGEDQARYVITVPAEHVGPVIGRANSAGLWVSGSGYVGGDSLILGDAAKISVAALRTAHENWFPAYMADEI